MEISGVGPGPAAGVNLEPGSTLLLAFKGGFLYTHFEGDGKYSSGGYKDEYEISSGQGFVSFALMFRFGEE
ncbi:MAG: hypothetical protein OEV42_07645 [Deltaproteobacteria bacterium]|nr:hypothetical protein [Deltaproteobacteria bacterium]